MKQYFCLGTYTEDILFGTGEVFHGKGEGVLICTLEDGRIDTVSAVSVRNPSYLCINEEVRRIYAVNEMKEYNGAFGGGVTELAYDEEYNMEIRTSFGTGGTDPCHIAMAPDHRLVAIANFASGSVTAYPLDENGGIVDNRMLFEHKGSSVHPKRQMGPHAHSCIFSPDGTKLYVPDLGTDQLKVYLYRDATLVPAPEEDIAVEPGNGPRSGVFSNDGLHFYLIDELGSSVEHYIMEGDALHYVETVSTLPEDYTGDNICSDLHITPDGQYLYASNRGYDSIASFKVGEDGRLEFLDRVPCGGRTPRNFAIDPHGRYALVGNQDSDCITVFEIRQDGSLQQLSSYPYGSPVCIRFF